MRILVTGGAGFIGSNIVQYHVDRGDMVHVVDDLSTGSLDNIRPLIDNSSVHFSEADILTWPYLSEAVCSAERIYHMAAVVGVFKVLEVPVQVLATNIAGTERLLRAAHNGNHNPQVIIASTAEVYGNGKTCENMCESTDGISDGTRTAGKKCMLVEFREDMEPMVGSSAVSRWNYSISKLADEAFGLSYARQYHMNIFVARFFNNIGPRQTGRYGMVVPRFVRQAVHGEPLTVFGDGSQTRCFCDVRDTVVALDLLACNPQSFGGIVNVGNDVEISIRDLADLVIERAGSNSQIDYIPYDKAYGQLFEETCRRKPSLQQLFALTGFQHKWTLENTLDYLIQVERETLLEKVNS